MLKQIEKGPLAVAVDASNWSSYSSGVLRKCGKNVNHAVTLVGLTAKGEWRVQNSWGTSWGEKGFMKLLLRDGDISNEKKSFFGSHFIIPLVEGQTSLDPELYSK